MHLKKPKWKRLAIVSAAFLLVSVGTLLYLSFSRFHFSNQAFPSLASFQWKRAPNNGIAVCPVIIGHRGSGLESANHDLLIGSTANAIQRAIDAGVDWIEIDIRLSRDGHLVAFHDETIDAKTSGEGMVSELSLEELQNVEVLVDPPESILSLDEVFSRFHAHDRKWVLDVKVNGIKDQVLEWVKRRLPKERVILFGTYDILQEYKGSGYSLGYTALWKNFGNRMRVLLAPQEVIRRCENVECKVLVLPVIFANRSLVEAAETRGIEVWVYNTDDELDLRYLAGRGVSGFIVDRPQQVVNCFPDCSSQAPSGSDGHAVNRSDR
ncbi:MAG TPA: hypothetical protein DDZ51_20785 [Planctomycetaceae bacterium]|jgi:glycerophosphoryl diester phosphodiesterase|nr:hypothetical protein [Planctomycetaceae bacterium]